jgi:phosphate transport system protein
VERRFENDLKELKSRILAMGGLVEQAIERATQALHERNPRKLEDVFSIEKKINTHHIDIDSSCVEVLARLSPVATDLRLILSILKINTDLERMGDQAVNIAYNAEHYLKDESIQAVDIYLPQMATAVRKMVRDSLDAFTNSDVVLAQNVLEQDDEVDSFKNRIFKTLIPFMKDHPSQVESAVDLILIARNLERMGDHATNIAEDVIFAYTGEDVRHGHQSEGES